MWNSFSKTNIFNSIGIGISEIVGESDESLIATEDDSDHEVFSDNDIGMVESKEKLNALQTDEITDVRHQGTVCIIHFSP